MEVCTRFVKELNHNSVFLKNTTVTTVVINLSIQIEFSLSKYSTKSDINNAVEKIVYRGGGTYTSLGLNDLRTEMQMYARPANSSVPRVAIVLTDGK